MAMRFRLLRRNFLLLLLVSFILGTLLFSTRVFLASHGDVGGGGGALLDHLSPGNVQGPVKFSFGSVAQLSQSVFASNYRQHVLNANTFPHDPELVLVVQVHNRPAYLRLLIQSLEKAAEVHRFLVIFSHDHVTEEMNAVVQDIRFCKVLQIYFPFSTQLFPRSFPGPDPRDCPRDASKDQALKTGCVNAAYPDSYGHYREHRVTQTKHHWWWKLHFVFERVGALQGYGGPLVLLEEDNYILPDFFHFYKVMQAFREKNCPDCDLLALGNHRSPAHFSTSSNQVSTTGWMSTKHNVGMSMSRELYYKLMGCSQAFCTYDDYNWDWTLQHLSGTCLPKVLKVLGAEATRVLHTGDCGLHHKDACNLERAAKKVEEELVKAKDGLFPLILVLHNEEPPEHKAHMKNGGWGDIRDHVLCNNYAKRL